MRSPAGIQSSPRKRWPRAKDGVDVKAFIATLFILGFLAGISRWPELRSFPLLLKRAEKPCRRECRTRTAGRAPPIFGSRVRTRELQPRATSRLQRPPD